MHRLNTLLDSVKEVVICDLERELEKDTKNGVVMNEIHSDIATLERIVHIKYHMGWLKDPVHHPPIRQQ